MSARSLLPGLSAAGAVALAAAVLVAGSGGRAPALAAGGAAAGSGVAVPAAATSLVCPGAATAVAGTGGAAPSRTATALQVAGAAAGSGADAAAPDAAGLTASALSARPDAVPTVPTGPAAADAAGSSPAPAAPVVGRAVGQVVTATVPGAGGGVVTAAPSGGRTPVLAGATTALAARGDLRGLSTPACVTAASSSWLVGGTTGVGRSVRLVVANPGATAVTVDTTVLTSAGPQQPAALQGLSLGAGERRSVLLEGAVQGTGPIAVQVRPAAGAVAAWLTEQVLRGLVPGGTDVVVPAADPARHVLVPGIVVPDGGTAPVLRLAAPGAASPVVARYALLGADGAVVPAGTSPAVVVPPGAVVDVPLPGLRPGEVTAVVDADGPLVAGALTDTAPGPLVPGDTAWTTSSAPLDGEVLVALPPAPARGATAPRARLVLTATAPTSAPGTPATAAVDVRAVDATGAVSAPQRLRLAAGTTAGTDVARLGGTARSPLVGLLVAPIGGAEVVAALRADTPAPEGAASGAGPLLSVHPVAPAPSGPDEVAVRLDAGP